MKDKNYVIIDNEFYDVVKGEIIAVNSNGTYDVKISQTKNKYPHVKNIGSEKVFNVGDKVKVGLEYQNKKLPIIIG